MNQQLLAANSLTEIAELLNACADVNAVCEFGQTNLHLLMEKSLVRAEIHIDMRSIRKPTRKADLEVATLLINRGSNIETVEFCGATPFLCAGEKRDELR